MSGPSVPSIAAQAARPGRRGSLPSARLAAAAAGLVVSVTVVTWWVVGDRSPHVAATLSYDLGPYAMAPALERTLGLVALAGTLFCSATLIRAAARHRLDARWWAPLAVAVLAGIVAALTWRAATAGFVGATIGGGVFALIVGGWVCLGLLAVAAVVAVIVAKR